MIEALRAATSNKYVAMQKGIKQIVVPIILKERCTTATFFALRLTPILDKTDPGCLGIKPWNNFLINFLGDLEVDGFHISCHIWIIIVLYLFHFLAPC